MKAAVLAVATCALLWANLEAYPSANSYSNVLLAYRFVAAGSARIDDVPGVPGRYRDRERIHERPEYNRFAPGTAVALVPAVALGLALGLGPSDIETWSYVDKAVATLLVVVAALASYAAARRLAGDRAAFLGTFAIVAATSIATVVGQRSWQHALGTAAVALGWLLLVRGRDDPRWLGRSGLPLALAITARYALAAIWIVALVGLVARRPRTALSFVAWSVPPLAFLALYDTVLFGNPAAVSYTPQLWQWSSLEGLPGNLVSPSRGLLIFSPFLVAALWAFSRRARRDALAAFALAAFAAMLAVHGLYIEWWGGWSYGNRYLVEALPILATGVALAWRDARGGARLLIAAAIVFAVALQAAGLVAYYHFWDGYNWDAAREPAGGSAMWDLSDPQWLWTLRAALATGGVRLLLVVPVAAAFAYVAFRGSTARTAPL